MTQGGGQRLFVLYDFSAELINLFQSECNMKCRARSDKAAFFKEFFGVSTRSRGLSVEHSPNRTRD